MARTAKKLKELTDLFEENEIEIGDCDLSILKGLTFRVSQISDKRHPSYIKHTLCDIIMITLLAILTNANEWLEIETFGQQKEAWLRQFLRLENGIPSDDCFRTVISSLNVNYLYEIVIDFLLENVDKILNTFNEPQQMEESEILSFDGKTSCSSKRNVTAKDGSRALHTLNAYAGKYGMCIAQEFVDEKTNEITAMPDLLKRLNLKGTIATWDALNTQRDIVKTVKEGKGDYVAALKENQKNLYTDVRDYFTEDVLRELKGSGKDNENHTKTVEKEHSSVVTREYYLTTDIKWLYNKEKWAGLKAIGVERKIIKKNDPKKPIVHENRYFICSIVDIRDFARAVRGHWGVENGLHWHLDFTFKDDNNTTMTDNGAKGLQIFKKIALAILKIVKVIYPKRTSLKMIRYRLSLSYEKEIERIFKMLNVSQLKSEFKINC